MRNIVPILSLVLLAFSACTSSTNCFDAKLQERSKDTMCTMDCPGVTGCDGKTYCNECIAAQQGIRVK